MSPFPSWQVGMRPKNPKGVCSPKTSVSPRDHHPKCLSISVKVTLPADCPFPARPLPSPSFLPPLLPAPTTIDSSCIAWLSLNSGSSCLSFTSSDWEAGLPHHPSCPLCFCTSLDNLSHFPRGENSHGSSPRELLGRVTVTTQVAGVLPFTLLQALGSK